MEGRLGHLHCLYRIVGPSDNTADVLPRLERLARQDLIEAYSEALDLAFQNDPGVYVIRSVPVHLTFAASAEEPEPLLARRWGERLCGAVVRVIARDAGDGTNLVRFADQADYVAHFIADILADQAWHRWFYGAFSGLRGLSRAEALEAVIVQNREHLASIFRYLQRLGCLDALFASLKRGAAERLWFGSAARGDTVPNREAFRPFVTAALRLMGELGLLAAGALAEDTLLAEYMATNPPAPDWCDRHALAAAVLAVMRFLANRRFLTKPGPAFEQRLIELREQIRTELDWLDTEWLETGIVSLLSSEVRPQDRVKRFSPVSSSQRSLLAKIRDLLRAGAISLDRAQPDSASNALLIYAALAASDVQWEASPGACEMIRRLLLCWKWLLAVDSPAGLIRAHQTDEIAAALDTLPAGQRASAHDALESIFDLGAPALELLRELVSVKPPVSQPGSKQEFPSECAGIFLLLRALQDSRLPQMITAASGAPLSAMLLGLGVEWGGEGSLREGRFDPAVLLWAGFDPNDDHPPELSSPESPAFLVSLLQLLQDRHAVNSSAIHVCELNLRGREAVIVADADSAMWPLGSWLDRPEERPAVIASLIGQWKQAAGIEPIIDYDESGRDTFEASIAELTIGWPAAVPISIGVTLSAIAALRLWARWLPGASHSSVPYLLKNLIRRSGTIHVTARALEVRLEPAPIDIVLEMAGYLREISDVPWLDSRKVLFHIEGRP